MSRDTTLLHPELQEIIKKVVSECHAKGLKMKTTDTVRTKAEQDKLYAQGRTTVGKVVTWVKYPHSNHNWGMAVDFCRNDGKGAYNDTDGFFRKVGQIAKKYGLQWGGDWDSPDKPHLELTKYGSTNMLYKQFGSPENYKKTWKKGDTYMKVKRKVKFGIETKEIEAINDNGKNYYSITDIAKIMGRIAQYDSKTKITHIV